jgi:hypothetical protein
MHLTDHQKQQARQMHTTGMSYRAIAREIGCPSDSTVRALFVVKKKRKPVAATIPAKPKIKPKPKTPSVLIHRVRFSSTSVPMRRRYQYPPLDHEPSKPELYLMLVIAVRNTQC